MTSSFFLTLPRQGTTTRLDDFKKVSLKETDKRVATPYSVCLLIRVAKLETSYVLQGNKTKTYRGRCDCLTVSIVAVLLYLYLTFCLTG